MPAKYRFQLYKALHQNTAAIYGEAKRFDFRIDMGKDYKPVTVPIDLANATVIEHGDKGAEREAAEEEQAKKPAEGV